MNANVIEKIQSTNQKYLKNLVGKEIPQRLKDQLAAAYAAWEEAEEALAEAEG